VEIPLKELSPATSSPNSEVTTLSARIFYPCQDPAVAAPKTYWYPEPQEEYFAAYLQFLGASTTLSKFISFFPRMLYNIQLPVNQNVPLLSAPTSTQRWPTMIFSHGLGGTRNMYSHICGSIASHGAVVIAPEHRDGSAPVSFVRDEAGKVTHTVDYEKMSHDDCEETQNGRRKQLRQRLFEMGETYALLQALDKGVAFSNHAISSKSGAHFDLSFLKDSLNVHEPGSVHFAGHSFGACTALQYVKSIYYDPSDAPDTYQPLYTPPRDSQIVRQITPNTNLTLLDCWMLPTLDRTTKWLHDKPIPAYADNGPGGNVILSILSEGFYRWNANLNETKRAVSPDPSAPLSTWTPEKMAEIISPHLFYPVKSAHLSQSDFGILFPWISKKAFKAEEPERTLRLNVRAILEIWRNNGAELADTSKADMEAVQIESPELKQSHDLKKPRQPRRSSSSSTLAPGVALMKQDDKILLRKGELRGWVALGLNKENTETADDGSLKRGKKDVGRVIKEKA